MEKEKEQKKKPEPVTYYGKKLYRIHPLIARTKSPEPKVPDFSDKNIDDKRTNKS